MLFNTDATARYQALCLLLLLAAACCSSTTTSTTTIPVSDPNFVFSAYNWDVTPTAAIASNPGASLKFAVKRTTSLGLVVNTSTLAKTGSNLGCVVLAYSLDDLPWVYVSLVPTSDSLNASTVNLAQPGSLSASEIHDVRLYLYASCETEDRWLMTSTNSFLIVVGVSVDGNSSGSSSGSGSGRRIDDETTTAAAAATTTKPSTHISSSSHPVTSTPTPTTTTINPGGQSVPFPTSYANIFTGRNILVFGDSISEGTNAQNYNYQAGSCGNGGMGLLASGSIDSWAFTFAEALECELSLSAFAAQGYLTVNSYNYGNVPPLVSLSINENATAWNQVRGGVSRIPLLTDTPPTIVVQALGFNDQNTDVSPGNLTLAVELWLNEMRDTLRGASSSTAKEAPFGDTSSHNTTTIFVLAPFGGQLRTDNVTRMAILQGYANYQNKTNGGGGDPCTFLLDLFPYAQRGLMGLGAPTAESCDGTHPLARTHARLGAGLAKLAAKAWEEGGEAANGCWR